MKNPIFVVGAAFCWPALAGVSAIGVAASDGDVQIGSVRMPGLATLYEGAVLKTGVAPAQLKLQNGASVWLSGGAQAVVHADSLLLEKGSSQVYASQNYAIQARSVTLTATSGRAVARLNLSTDGALLVADVLGTFEIRRSGVSSAMAPGQSLQFAREPAEAGAVAPSQFKGCLAKSDKGYFLREGSTNGIIALRGESIKAKTGDRVTVVGKPDTAAAVAGAGQVVQVLRLTIDGHGCPASSVFAATGSAPATGSAGAAGSATAGMSTTTIAVVGVAAASAAIIPTVALTSGSDTSSSVSPSSR